MKAARFHKVGERLKLEEIERPSIKDNEVLLRVKAAGICHSDVHVIDGIIAANPPVILGHEIAGEIEEIGSRVENYKKGEKVLVHFLSPCGKCRYCLEGRSMQCEELFTRAGYGFSADGGYAEYCRVDADRLVKIPDTLPIEFAATLGCAGITAYHAVKRVARTNVAETVAIYGTGGVGMYALQIAKLSGARVIAIGRNEEKLRMAEKLGADHVLKATGEIKREMKKATDGKGVDLIFDFVVNEESVKNGVSMLANGGRLILVGVSNKPLTINPQTFVLKELELAGSLVGGKRELEELVWLASSNRLKSVVTNRFRLDDINNALESLRRSEVIGRGCILF